MKSYIFTFLLIVFYAALSAQQVRKDSASYFIADLHNDVLSGVTMKGISIEKNQSGRTHTDIKRLSESGVGIQFFSIFCNERYGANTAFRYALRQMDSLDALIARNPNKLYAAKSMSEIQHALESGKVASMKGVEGGHMIEDKIEYLDSLYTRGARYLTLTWNNSTSWASSAADESSGKHPFGEYGLNDFGIQVVKRMNELGMMVDVSHVGEKTFQDVINTSSKPIIASHSSVYAICPHPRNLKDYQIDAIAKNGGVIFVNFFSGFLDKNFDRRKARFDSRHKTSIDSLKNLSWNSYRIDEWLSVHFAKEYEALRPDLSVLIDHIDYLIKRAGINHVGLGSDFDGITSLPKELSGVQDFYKVINALKKRGYSSAEIRKIAGENFVRVFTDITAVKNPT